MQLIPLALPLVVVSLFSVACIGPATMVLPDPPTSDDRDAGERYYKSYGPLATTRNVVVSGNQYSAVASVGSISRLTLANGQDVVDPRSLKPAVLADSPTGAAIADIERVIPAYNSATMVSNALMMTGLAGMLGSIAAVAAPEELFLPILLGGLGGGGALMVVGLFSPAFFGSPGIVIDEARQRAFVTYDSSLREKLCLPDTDGKPTCSPTNTRGTTSGAGNAL